MVRLLCGGNWSSFLPEEQRIRIIDALSRNIWSRLFEAAARGDRAGRLYRPPRPPQRAYLNPRSNVIRNIFYRMRAWLQHDWDLGPWSTVIVEPSRIQRASRA